MDLAPSQMAAMQIVMGVEVHRMALDFLVIPLRVPVPMVAPVKGELEITED